MGPCASSQQEVDLVALNSVGVTGWSLRRILMHGTKSLRSRLKQEEIGECRCYNCERLSTLAPMCRLVVFLVRIYVSGLFLVVCFHPHLPNRRYSAQNNACQRFAYIQWATNAYTCLWLFPYTWPSSSASSANFTLRRSPRFETVVGPVPSAYPV